MATTLIPAKDVGRVILEDLRGFAEKEYPDTTEAEREKMIGNFLNAWSRGMFHGPAE